MTDTATRRPEQAPARPEDPLAGVTARGRWPRRLAAAARGAARTAADELVAVMLFAGFALVITAGMWSGAATEANPRDHAQFLFFFEHAAHSVTHLHNPLFTPLMGAPNGVNLMANTALLGLTLPLVPVTLIAGPEVSYGLAMTIGLAGTAVAWYVFVRRHIWPHRGIAFAAGALAGFSPGIVGHANAHPNFVAQFMVPLIISSVIRLRSAARPVRSSVLLGLMIAYQIFLNEELLLFTAVACLLMAVVYVASRPRVALAEAPRFLAGLGVAGGVAAALAAYPLWFQFFGPQHYSGPLFWAKNWYLDLIAYPTYGANAIAGWLTSGSGFNNDPPETNAFLGLPLMLFAVAVAVMLWRQIAVRVAAVIGLVFMFFSFGDTLHLRGASTGIPGPYRYLRGLPLFDSVITSRFGLAVAPAIAVLLACAGRHLLARAPHRQRMLAWAALAAVLVPLTPTTIKTTPAMTVPAFYSDGTWRRFVDDGSIVPVPPNLASEPTLRALLATGLGARFIDGYFLGPNTPEDSRARYGPFVRPTLTLLERVGDSGEVPEITEQQRATALVDLRYWGADVLVLAHRPNERALRETVEALLRMPGVRVDDVWVWDVRSLT